MARIDAVNDNSAAPIEATREALMAWWRSTRQPSGGDRLCNDLVWGLFTAATVHEVPLVLRRELMDKVHQLAALHGVALINRESRP